MLSVTLSKNEIGVALLGAVELDRALLLRSMCTRLSVDRATDWTASVRRPSRHRKFISRTRLNGLSIACWKWISGLLYLVYLFTVEPRFGLPLT